MHGPINIRYAKTVHPELLKDLSYVISDISNAYFVIKYFRTIFKLYSHKTEIYFAALCKCKVPQISQTWLTYLTSDRSLPQLSLLATACPLRRSNTGMTGSDQRSKMALGNIRIS